MGKLFCLMGKSASGKDTIYQMLLKQREFDLQKIVPYTTRPIRTGETWGVEYRFTDEDGLRRLTEQNRVIELRAYDTVYGIWKYFTVDDGQVDLRRKNYLIIGTLKTCEKLRRYYGTDNVVPIYIETDNGLRLQRALDRERLQEEPGYAELCRRFLADEEDFSEEKLLCAGIRKRFENDNLNGTVKEILDYMRSVAI